CVYRDYTFCLGSTAELCCILVVGLLLISSYLEVCLSRLHLLPWVHSRTVLYPSRWFTADKFVSLGVSIETTPFALGHSRTVLYPSRWFTADKFVSLGVSIETTPFALGPQPNCAVS
ncbi:hypothetical protein J6590_095311, partial [Homalodisca vitripennis]